MSAISRNCSAAPAIIRAAVLCTFCGRPLAAGARFCGACGRPASEPRASFDLDYIEEALSVSVREAVLLDKITGSEIIRSPVFRFLAFVAVVPLAIEILQENHAILYGLALWSMALWSLLLYRLFADRDLSFRLAFGTVLFTCFIGLPILEIWLFIPPDVTGWMITRNFLAFRLSGYIFGVGVREELTKAIPLLALAVFTTKMRKPINGLLLGMMSGIGFAGAENVYYVFRTLDEALRAMKETGMAGYLVMPVYNNVVRMAMTPFLHACFSAIFGYFIALAAADRRHRVVFLLLGLGLSSLVHGLYDTFVGESPLLGVVVQCAAFFLVMTYILKARGLSSARELGGGVFSRTVMMKAPVRVAASATPQVAPAAPLLMAPATAAASWRLRGVAGPAFGRTFDLMGETRLGRDPARCAVLMEEKTVSREHAALVPDPGRLAWRLQRLSHNAHVYVNGRAVDEAFLAPGDQIQVGTSVLVLEVA
jgi:RsiW-degrading membrane proteinase PrsW (M82 family)